MYIYIYKVAAGGKFSRWGTTSQIFIIHPNMIYPSITKKRIKTLNILNKENCFTKFKIEDDSHKTIFYIAEVFI